MKLNRIFIPLLLVVLAFSSCEKDDPEIGNEEEIITTLNYTLTPASGGTIVVLTFQDLDGDGGDAPVITGGTLAAGESYTGVLELLNETESPAEDITEEVKEEDEDHQFFFESTVSDLSIVYTDQDADGNPVGINTTLATGVAGSGSLTITLRHEPSKSASNVAAGDITSAGGETDIEVEFPISIQ